MNNSFKLCSSEEAVESSDIILLLVEHTEFKKLNTGVLSDKIVIDTKGLW
jgi:UDP-N-acetyl-D-mannosaminuronic acid dehydrogenase